MLSPQGAPKPPEIQPFRAFAALSLMLYALFTIAGSAQAEPFLPQNGGQVLEHLRSKALDPEARKTRELRVRLSAAPNDLELASKYVRRCIEQSREEADPRYLGRAEAALSPWWRAAAPPPEALVLRATIRQSQHDFTNALADLDLALKRAPSDAQAWLTRATVLTVLGEYPAARRACVPLAQLAPGLVALTAAANVSCLTGDAARGSELLRSALDSLPRAPISERVGALLVLAETSARLGRGEEAEECFRSALDLAPRDPYLQGAYGDLLLDQHREKEAVALLSHAPQTDGLLLRLTLAESRLSPSPASFAIHKSLLMARFEAGHLRGDFVHQREEARFALELLRAPEEALRLAQENWHVQHEPADARILLECALAASDRAAAAPVLDFIRTTRIEDNRLRELSNALDRL